MALPTDRTSFIKYCLQKLGSPVIEINVAPDQIDDRVDEALQYYMDFHFDGTDKIYYKYQITQTDITNRYVTVPDNIIGVVNLFPIGQSFSSNDMFNIRYQIALNDLYTLTSVSMVPYYMALSHIALLEELLVGKQPIRYNRNNNKLYIDMDWNIVNVGDYIVAEAYQVLDPTVYIKAWKDLWLMKYATALIKEQWGSNLTKFTGMALPGNIKFNGEKIYNDAIVEKQQLEREMVTTWSLPATDMIG